MTIPFVDLFAGPGGLGEGFSAYTRDGKRPFRPAISIEMDEHAHATLQLRSFFRQFRHKDAKTPEEYYEHLAGRITRKELFDAYPEERDAAMSEALQIELGGEGRQNSPESVDGHMRSGLAEADTWVLLGGPPCQAYSGVGRSKMIGELLKALLRGRKAEDVPEEELRTLREQAEEDFSHDKRHTLYQEYLRIIAKHAPPVFVMENVRGILSSKKNGSRIFSLILRDLMHPWGVAHEYWPRSRFRNHRYRLYSFVTGQEPQPEADSDYLIRSERYGIPQARHRVIVLGIRRDIADVAGDQLRVLSEAEMVTLRDVIGKMPRLRSGVSRGGDSTEKWVAALSASLEAPWFGQLAEDIQNKISASVDELSECRFPIEAPSVGAYPDGGDLRNWYYDSRLRKIPNGASTRRHMATDLQRYLFMSAFTEVRRKSPKLEDFPTLLLPAHDNIDKKNPQNAHFADRFRVQSWGRPSTTITSHIAKDGHYFVHPDPCQARSLTVREAARLQTFPDNYYFCGKQTHQYKQVGNAVPPLLASQLAAIVHSVLEPNK